MPPLTGLGVLLGLAFYNDVAPLALGFSMRLGIENFHWRKRGLPPAEGQEDNKKAGLERPACESKMTGQPLRDDVLAHDPDCAHSQGQEHQNTSEHGRGFRNSG